MIVKTTNQPENSQEIDAMICWMGEKPLRINDKFGVRQTTRTGRCVIKEIIYKMDLEKLKRIKGEVCCIKMILD